MTITTSLRDPWLGLAADALDDLERTRIANENRLRTLTTSEPDSDGNVRGFGLDHRVPEVKILQDLVTAIAAVEHQASLNLARAMRKHPLGPWVKAQAGVGERQAARLLAVVGDPYLREIFDEDGEIVGYQPRTVSQLWALCGYRTDDGVAQRRQKGVKSNWNAKAKMRAYLIAEVCVRLDGKPDKNGKARARSPYRDVYDDRKAATQGRLHQAPCVRCGPAGHPAQPGSPWSDAHRHADAIRVAAKTLLKDLWIEARRIHQGITEQAA